MSLDTLISSQWVEKGREGRELKVNIIYLIRHTLDT